MAVGKNSDDGREEFMRWTGSTSKTVRKNYGDGRDELWAIEKPGVLFLRIPCSFKERLERYGNPLKAFSSLFIDRIPSEKTQTASVYLSVFLVSVFDLG
ncbi:hypothetical protein M5K25_011247 [Dendrobium thyrsiflorum]|uniref:Uncharacterized protein n=1 Tax=Dendrobium thyrsiflorum TaxID=117978 RepID=A0ABD0V2K5_DENTH